MTKTDLHNIPGVLELPKHPPLVAVIQYLREHHPENMADKADHWRGWFDALYSIEAACTPATTGGQEAKKSAPYTQPPKPEAK